MCAVLFKGDCGWEEEKDPDLCYAMLFVQIENSCFFPDIFVCLPELMLILKNRNMLGKRNVAKTSQKGEKGCFSRQLYYGRLGADSSGFL